MDEEKAKVWLSIHEPWSVALCVVAYQPSPERKDRSKPWSPCYANSIEKAAAEQRGNGQRFQCRAKGDH
jgi:hypothetical protein